MQVTYRFALDARVIDKATNTHGHIVTLGTDELGAVYEVAFDTRIMGRRRHWKRTAELKAEPQKKKNKTKTTSK